MYTFLLYCFPSFCCPSNQAFLRLHSSHSTFSFLLSHFLSLQLYDPHFLLFLAFSFLISFSLISFFLLCLVLPPLLVFSPFASSGRFLTFSATLLPFADSLLILVYFLLLSLMSLCLLYIPIPYLLIFPLHLFLISCFLISFCLLYSLLSSSLLISISFFPNTFLLLCFSFT